MSAGTRITTVMAVAGIAIGAGSGVAQAAGMPGNSGSFKLTARSTTAASGYAPTFTGNGLLGVRVPAAGQGYAGGKVPAQSELAGFYAKPSKGKASERVQQRANIPTWSTLTFADGGHTFSPSASAGAGKVSGYRQSIDLHTGIVTTHARWTAPDGHVTTITYQVLTNRALENVGLVRVTLRPQWSGDATVTDEIDGTPDTKVPAKTPVLTGPIAKSWDPAQREDDVTVTALGTGIRASIASRLVPSANITAPSTKADQGKAQSVAQRIRFPVTSGHTYTLTKYVGISSTPPTLVDARAAATSAAGTPWPQLLQQNASAWASLWRGRIDVAGDPTLATDVNASEFYLWSSTRADQDWSISPAGLSSNGYDGHIFWDAETWMFPSLLAQHPDLADAMEAYRDQRLPEAFQHAAATGHRGARFPWESALNGTEQIPPPVSVNSEGLYEQHITADIALAQWQYYEATGDLTWLETQGWPVISGAARFWAARATRTAGGYEIRNVTGPDEENPDVNTEVYTEVGARTTLRDAIAAAKVLGAPVPGSWARIAAGLRVPVTDGINPEFDGYQGQLVKQADVTLLGYPWGFASSAAVERADLAYYVPRTDPGGPSMSDAVNSIESDQLDPGGCQAFVYTERSYQPFLRDVFHQFSETRTGGAFTFMTGIGGFLQEFLYGYSGLRWQGSAVHLSPGLSGPLTGVTLRDLSWRGRTFTVAIRRDGATVTLDSGAPLPISTPSGGATVRAGHPVTIVTPGATTSHAGTDPLLCGAASASNTAPGAPALAAVDGSNATDWQPAKLPATLTAPVTAARTLSSVTVRWGQAWPPVLKPNVHPKPSPVETLRSRGYAVQVSADGRTWRTVATVATHSTRLTDTVMFPATRARAVRLRLVGGTGQSTVKTKTTPSTPILPMVQELTAR